MWRSDRDKPSKLLRASAELLAHAKADRTPDTSYFHDATKKWKPVVRKVVELDELQLPPTTADMPAFLRHRPVNRKATLFFKTNVVTRGKGNKRP